MATIQGIRNLPNMEVELQTLLGQIPRGCVTTYGSLARQLGDVIASRWVGKFLLHHRHGSRCKCHRVVRADGSLGGYVSGSVEEKAMLLRNDGIELDLSQDRVNLSRFGCQEFRGSAPLQALKTIQEDLSARVNMEPLSLGSDRVGGLDVSYVPGTSDAVAAYAEVSFRSGELTWSSTIRRTVTFPYISSFLAFRELPILSELLDEVSRNHTIAEILLVDGSGLLHPRRAGIATMLGVLFDWPTIGVTKKHLAGKVQVDKLHTTSVQPIVLDGQQLGATIKPRLATSKPLFVSPGHRTDVASAVKITQQLILGRRLPEPLYWADRLSRQQARGRS